MGMFVGGKRGIVSDMNVVPLIDILLVLLVIFMIIPVHNMGLDAQLPQPSRIRPIRLHSASSLFRCWRTGRCVSIRNRSVGTG
jgi:biopolymer transport protein ExbD